jgi:ribulose-5-phosphate 4-epimerase/fuculose-1-phosphate aldolase
MMWRKITKVGILYTVIPGILGNSELKENVSEGLFKSSGECKTICDDVSQTGSNSITTTATAATVEQKKQDQFFVTIPSPSATATATATATTQIPKPDESIIGYPVSRYCQDRRMIDIPETVQSKHRVRNPLNVSTEEWEARTELAAAYRALYLLGLGSDQAAQCLMLRVPPSNNNNIPNVYNDDEITFLMTDWGVWFEEVTASNLLHFSINGDQLLLHDDGSRRRVPGNPLQSNIGCIPVAKGIFESRPDVNMIVHIHPYAVMAVGGLDFGLLPLSQAAFFLFGQVSREQYDFTYENNFEEALARGFSQGQRAMLLNHHGMYSVGRDVAEGIFVATHLTQACEVQVKTLSMVGGDLSKVRVCFLPLFFVSIMHLFLVE